MPPRNSKTKPFKKYNREFIKRDSLSYFDTINVLTAKYIEPSKCVNNKYNKAFEKYKSERISKGLNTISTIELITKTDKESDNRYVNSNWYQKRSRGDPNAW